MQTPTALQFREAYLHTLNASVEAWLTDPLVATAAMSSENRAPSAVRNLRSLFENKASTLDSPSPDSRGRSPSGVGGSDKENGSNGYRPKSKVRASFIQVDLAGGMATAGDGKSGVGARRGSFSEMDGDGALSDLKRTISEQQKQRLVPEGAIESAAPTPLKKPGEGRLGHDMPPENPDKSVTGIQDSADLKPADPASEDAVSGGDALPPVSEDLRSAKSAGKKVDAKKPLANGKPAAISTKAPPKTSSSAVKSPASQPKTPTSTKVSGSSTASPAHKAPLKKPSRSSLTAPTAASLARSGAGADNSSNTKTSPTAKPKPREVTKPANVPSHLLAPTAASRAKHEAEVPPVPSVPKTTLPSRPKATAPAKTAPRASLGPARPASRDSSSTTRKSINPNDSSFLDRMMKPTTASVNRHAEKPEAKSPPKATASKPAAPAATKPKVNGSGSKSAPKSAPSAPAPAPEDPIAEDPSFAEAVKDDLPQENGTAPDAHLEATPAAIGGEETIR